eukprot:9082752-Pyramimonas_sp.AAC.1
MEIRGVVCALAVTGTGGPHIPVWDVPIGAGGGVPVHDAAAVRGLRSVRRLYSSGPRGHPGA